MRAMVQDNVGGCFTSWDLGFLEKGVGVAEWKLQINHNC
jgi:hypothetical protein